MHACLNTRFSKFFFVLCAGFWERCALETHISNFKFKFQIKKTVWMYLALASILHTIKNSPKCTGSSVCVLKKTKVFVTKRLSESELTTTNVAWMNMMRIHISVYMSCLTLRTKPILIHKIILTKYKRKNKKKQSEM